MNKKYGIRDVDPAVILTMIERGRLNRAAKKAGSLQVYCTACGGILRDKKGGRAGKDYQDYRQKRLFDPKEKEWIDVTICEPCNRVYFDHKKWMGEV